MKKFILIACIGFILLTGILCNMKEVAAKETSTLQNSTLEKIETLSSSESHDIPTCIEGKGYCIINGKPFDGLKIKK